MAAAVAKLMSNEDLVAAGPLRTVTRLRNTMGERPGLATAASLSAYVALRPRSGQTDADRNLISNVHDGGTSPADGTRRLLALLDAIRAAGRSGVMVKEPSAPVARA
jgi:ethanolamine ammonia-lyase small subunit